MKRNEKELRQYKVFELWKFRRKIEQTNQNVCTLLACTKNCLSYSPHTKTHIQHVHFFLALFAVVIMNGVVAVKKDIYFELMRGVGATNRWHGMDIWIYRLLYNENFWLESNDFNANGNVS